MVRRRIDAKYQFRGGGNVQLAQGTMVLDAACNGVHQPIQSRLTSHSKLFGAA